MDVCLTIVGRLTDARQVFGKPEYESLNVMIKLCYTVNCRKVTFGAEYFCEDRSYGILPLMYCSGNPLVLLSNCNKANHDSEEVEYVDR